MTTDTEADLEVLSSIDQIEETKNSMNAKIFTLGQKSEFDEKLVKPKKKRESVFFEKKSTVYPRTRVLSNVRRSIRQ